MYARETLYTLLSCVFVLDCRLLLIMLFYFAIIKIIIIYKIFVEIDESKFDRRKYNRRHRVDGQWIFGGVQRETGACFLIPVERRDKDTLLTAINDWILPGITIISDCR